MRHAAAQGAVELTAQYRFTIETDPDELERLIDAVKEIGEKESWPSDLVFRVHLALEELGLNIINYGYDEGVHEIECMVTSQPEEITIEVWDDGRPFDPLNDAPDADVTSALKDRRIGGQGVHLVRTMMDQFRYQRVSGRNHVTLVSRRVG
jgi:anti-sigma regulatory factor (Ser/Thr protein kinase)